MTLFFRGVEGQEWAADLSVGDLSVSPRCFQDSKYEGTEGGEAAEGQGDKNVRVTVGLEWKREASGRPGAVGVQPSSPGWRVYSLLRSKPKSQTWRPAS